MVNVSLDIPTADPSRVMPYPAASSPGRARNMRAIKRTGTKPEVAIRSALHAKGYRFRKDYLVRIGDFKVKPDIVFTRKRVAVFVDGCFWHCCPSHGRTPSTNEWYWSPKLIRNQTRDAEVNRALSTGGWTVIRIWEHVNIGDALDAIEHSFDCMSSA